MLPNDESSPQERNPVVSRSTESAAIYDEDDDGSRPPTSSDATETHRSEGEDSSDSDVDLEDLMTTALLENEKQKLLLGDLKAAEKVFKKCSSRIASSTTNKKHGGGITDSLKSLEVAENLLVIYNKQERWAKVQTLLTHKIRLKEHIGRKETVDYLEDVVALARLSQRHGDSVEAQLHAKRGLAWSIRLQRSEVTRSCLMLLIELCKDGNDRDGEKAYNTMLADMDFGTAEPEAESPPGSSGRLCSSLEGASTKTSGCHVYESSTLDLITSIHISEEQTCGALHQIFMDIDFDSEISTWSIALDRAFGTGTLPRPEAISSADRDAAQVIDLLSTPRPVEPERIALVTSDSSQEWPEEVAHANQVNDTSSRINKQLSIEESRPRAMSRSSSASTVASVHSSTKTSFPRLYLDIDTGGSEEHVPPGLEDCDGTVPTASSEHNNNLQTATTVHVGHRTSLTYAKARLVESPGK